MSQNSLNFGTGNLGEVLTSQGPGNAPAFAPPVGGGGITAASSVTTFAPAAIGDQLNIAHGLGAIPGFFRFTWGALGTAFTYGVQAQGFGVWNSTSGTFNTWFQLGNPTGDTSWSTGANAIFIDAINTGPTNNWNATFIGVDATNITFQITSFSNAQTIGILWEAFL
ncbi:MAG: hypothetical protein GY775_01080 [Candidatus Scalindua sp.]|nr:hypothetical protein [Candidatus Scalindua sp.]